MSRSLGKGALSGGIISLNVGTPAIPFDVHLELLCDSCPYFDELFHDRFAGVPRASVSLPDDDPDAFTEFFNWMYRGTIFQNEPHPHLRQLFQLWILADKLKIVELQNLVVTRCKKVLEYKKHDQIEKDTINYVYNNTLSNSPLRQMVVDISMERMSVVLFRTDMTEFPRTFLEDLCVSWIETRDDIKPVGLSDIEEYFTRRTVLHTFGRSRSPSPRFGGEPDIVRQATELEMGWRKIRRPVSRKHTGRATPSTGIATPSSTFTDTQGGRTIAQELENLEL